MEALTGSSESENDARRTTPTGLVAGEGRGTKRTAEGQCVELIEWGMLPGIYTTPSGSLIILTVS